MEPLLVHVGCGKVFLPGYQNIDLFDTVKADAYHEMMALPFAKESVDRLYSSHVLEHQHRRKILATLSYWVSLLKPGGILRLAVPDFAAVCRYYQWTGKLEDVMGLLYGGQDQDLNRHTITFDQRTLTDYMTKAGLVDVKPWDWRTTEHAAYDDYSQCYLPHRQPRDPSGLQMSLNLEGVKPK